MESKTFYERNISHCQNKLNDYMKEFPDHEKQKILNKQKGRKKEQKRREQKDRKTKQKRRKKRVLEFGPKRRRRNP